MSQHQRASAAGAEVLRAGGNAVDAAVATAFALGVLEPWMSGIGGGGYLLVGRPGETPALVDFNLRAPHRARQEDYPIVAGRSSDIFPWPLVQDERNTCGALAVCAPTMTAGLELAWRKFGETPWETLLEPAIGFARQGLVVDSYARQIIDTVAEQLSCEPAEFLGGASADAAADAAAPAVIGLGRLADTLSVIAKEKSAAAVSGDIARALTDDIAARGGVVQMRDFAAAAPRLRPPGHVSYRGGGLWSTRDCSGGATVLRIMRALAGAPLPADVDADFYGALVEAIAPALQERLQTLGDCDANGRRPSCTTHFCVADAGGLTVSATTTLVSMFGSKVLSAQTGIMLNNGMAWFDPIPGRANSIGPSKYCLNNMAPALMHMPQRGLLAVGAAGGRKIIPTVTQLLAFVRDAGLPLEQACKQPRLDVQADRTIVADDRLDAQTLALLARHGRVCPETAAALPYQFGITAALLVAPGRAPAVEAMPDALAPWAGAACG